jgi:predicted nucleic acid-binding protein
VVLVIDSSVWVASYIQSDVHHQEAARVVADVVSKQYRVILPSIALTEIVSSITRRAKDANVPHSAGMVLGEKLIRNPNIAWKTVDKAFAYEASVCAATHGLKTGDSIFAATAIFYGIPLLTEDKEFQNVVDVVSVLSLRDI